MRWLSYADGLTLAAIAAVAVLFTVIDYVWCKRELARQAKLASDESDALYVGASTLGLHVDSEPLPRGWRDDQR